VKSIMKKFELIRITNSEYGTFGVYLFKRIPFAVTLEPPWKDNVPEESCIPEDVYIAELTETPSYGLVYKFLNVPNRTDVLNHWGNLLKNTQGCVLIAEKFGVLDGKPAVLTSHNSPGEGFNEFMNLANGDRQIQITIRNCWL